MRKLLIATALALTTAPAFAAELAIGTRLGTTEQAITAALTEMGWEVRKLDAEDGMIEAYAMMGDTMAEIYADPTTGEVTRISDEA
ncbi:MAG TPA: PepSY domain-containing protein [Rhodobacteraceae bacterium]|nr:PepSY domain-containing protein [Paracoccaceae bacterium]